MHYAVFGPTYIKDKDRLYTDYKHVAECLDTVRDIDGLVLGGGKGIEALAQAWATENSVPFELVAPELSQRDRVSQDKIFVLRNNRIFQTMDGMILFWDSTLVDHLRLLTTANMLKKKCVVFPL